MSFKEMVHESLIWNRNGALYLAKATLATGAAFAAFMGIHRANMGPNASLDISGNSGLQMHVPVSNEGFFDVAFLSGWMSLYFFAAALALELAVRATYTEEKES